ncbi:MAG: CcmD family protein [Vicinamibacterales bacterium]|nr:CcmD family protein [Vicinamibacterales bacterium]
MRILRILAVVGCLGVVAPVASYAQGQTAARDEYVPISELPQDEQLPAAPMVVAAYAFVWVAFVGYVFTLVGRTKKLEADLKALERETR